MKIKEGFELRSICGVEIIIAHGVENIDFTKVISLNESAALLWRAIADKDFSLDTLVEITLDNYEVDEDTARHDCEELIASWKEQGFIE